MTISAGATLVAGCTIFLAAPGNGEEAHVGLVALRTAERTWYVVLETVILCLCTCLSELSLSLWRLSQCACALMLRRRLLDDRRQTTDDV